MPSKILYRWNSYSLLPFTAVKNLFLHKEFVPVEGLEPSEPLQENIGQFVAARQLSGCPIAISVWDRS
jgi:hypothetical protein